MGIALKAFRHVRHLLPCLVTALRIAGAPEVRTLSPDRQLLFLAGQRPVIATKLRYYADREFVGRYDPA